MLPRAPGLLRGEPALADRRRDPRPALAQGNLQHSRIRHGGPQARLAPALRHRIAGYLASPLWAAQSWSASRWPSRPPISARIFLHRVPPLPVWPRFDPVRALQLFGITMAILLAPKLFGLILGLLDATVRRASGGALRLVLSALIETLLSALIAPIAMLVQSGSVIQILLRRDAGWNPQRRDDGSIPLSDIVRRHRWHTILGLVAGRSRPSPSRPRCSSGCRPPSSASSSRFRSPGRAGKLALGLALKRAGLLMTPEEREPPAIAVAAKAIEARNAALGFDDADGVRALHADPDLQAGHLAFLPPAEPRPRGAPQPTTSWPRPRWSRPRPSTRRRAGSTPRRRWCCCTTGRCSTGWRGSGGNPRTSAALRGRLDILQRHSGAAIAEPGIHSRRRCRMSLHHQRSWIPGSRLRRARDPLWGGSRMNTPPRASWRQSSVARLLHSITTNHGTCR